MKKILIVLTVVTVVGCSKTDQPKMESTKQSEEMVKRINDTKEICESMKGELYQMKKKIDSKEFATSISEYQYRMKLPEIYLKSSTEYIKVCGAFNDK